VTSEFTCKYDTTIPLSLQRFASNMSDSSTDIGCRQCGQGRGERAWRGKVRRVEDVVKEGWIFFWSDRLNGLIRIHAFWLWRGCFCCGAILRVCSYVWILRVIENANLQAQDLTKCIWPTLFCACSYYPFVFVQEGCGVCTSGEARCCKFYCMQAQTHT